MADNQAWARDENNQKNAFSEVYRSLEAFVLLKLKKAALTFSVQYHIFPTMQDLKIQDIYAFVSAERSGKRTLLIYWTCSTERKLLLAFYY